MGRGRAAEGFGYLLKDRVLEIGDFLSAVKRVGKGGTAIQHLARAASAVSPKTVETHVNSIFGNSASLPAQDEHRQHAAVLAYLRA